MVHEDQTIGDLRKVVIHDGHPGPIEIGCNIEFLEWLTDPVLNGGGAVIDFGCYGANLMTWLMKGQRPTAVYGVTQQIKPDKYPKVDDEATIILTYPKAQVIIQASWNWSHNRKDMEVYGTNGYVICKNGTEMSVLENEEDGAFEIKAKPLVHGYHDPFALFHKVVKKNHELPPYDVSSLENNILVMQILEAAKHSAKTGETVHWKDFFGEK